MLSIVANEGRTATPAGEFEWNPPVLGLRVFGAAIPERLLR